jgi:uncharacterized protein YggE
MKLTCSFFILAILMALGANGQTTPPQASVVANGTASISVTPDQAQINVSATTQAATAQDATSQNATITTNIISQITQALGGSGTVQTVNYSVSPNYNYPPNGTPVLTGYTVTNSIQVTLNDLTMTGKIIDTAVQAGASRIDSLQFSLKDDSTARAQALSAATVKAKAKATAMAASVGLTASSFITIQESGSNVVTPVLTPTAGVGATTTPVQPGQLTVTANVTISMRLM